MLRITDGLVVNPTANQTHPRIFITHSLSGLRIECNHCIESVGRHDARACQGPSSLDVMNTSPASPIDDDTPLEDASLACVLTINANDPSGAGGLSADVATIASVGGHALPVITGTYVRDTANIFEHFALDDEAVTEQARSVLEDIPVQVIKVGFVGSPENISAVAELCSDYPDIPVVAYMPNLSWWEEDRIDAYLDAFEELLLPQVSVLSGNHSTLCRWLLPDWSSQRDPSARDLAAAASQRGVPYTLVTGIPLPSQQVDNVLASPQAVLTHQSFEMFDAVFTGAGDTLSAALTALIGTGMDLSEAVHEALSYMDRCLAEGFRPGMGHVIPDRLFWAEPEPSSDDPEAASERDLLDAFEIPPHDTKH